jgi:RecB family exonuclease
MPSRSGSGKAARTAAERKPAFSPTKINTFLECAVKYRYIYIDKIGRFYLRSRPGFSFGSTLHQVLQQFHDYGGVSTAEEMTAGLEEKWIAAGYESAQQEREHQEAAREIVAAYHSAYQERAIEQVTTIATEKTISCDMGRFKLTGRVDRIDRHADGTLDVVDYKSGRLDVSPEEVAGSLAMCCYQLIMQRLYPDASIRGTIYCLRSGVTASYSLAGAALEDFAADIISIGNRILDTGWEELRPIEIEICPECDFLSRCRTYWRQQQRLEAAADGEFSD